MTRGRQRLMGASIAFTLVAGRAHAGEPAPQDVALARQLFEEGIALEKKGDCANALDRFRRVATVKSSPSLKFHTGLCEEKLGHLVSALTFYQEAQSEASQKANQEVLGAVKAPLASLDKKLPKLVALVTDTPDLEVSVDGKAIPKGLWGLELRVEPGRHTVEGKAPGMEPSAQTLEFPEGARIEVHVKLDTKRVAPIAPAAPTATAIAPAPTPPPSAPQPSPNEAPPVEAPPKTSHAFAIATTAGAVVLIGGGFASFFYSGSLASDDQTQCLKEISCDNLKGPVRTWDTLALTGWIAGAALAGVAIYAWTRPGESAKAQAVIVPGPGSLFLRGSF